MDVRDLSRLIEQAVAVAAPEKLLRFIGRIETALATAAPDSLQHVMRRLVLSAATDSQQTQRNAIAIFLHLLRTHPAADTDALHRLVAEETHVSKTVNKGERNHFLFARVSLGFILLNERGGAEKEVARLYAAAEGSPFALFVLGGLFTVFPASPPAIELLQRLCALPPAQTFHCFDFLLSAERALVEHTGAEGARERRNSLVARLREVTRAVRGFFEPAAFLATFETAQNDPQFSGRAELLGTASKAAQFVLRNLGSRGRLVAPLLREFSVRAEEGRAPGRAASLLFLAFAGELFAAHCPDTAELPELCRFLAAAGRLPGLRQRTEAVRAGVLARVATEGNAAAAEHFLKEWFLAGQGAAEGKAWRAVLSLLGPDQATEAMCAVEARLDGAASLAEVQSALDRLGLLAAAGPAEVRSSAVERVAQLYHHAEQTAAALSVDLSERSPAALAQAVQAAAHQQLLHRLLPVLAFEELQLAAERWVGEGDSVAAECFAAAPQLRAAGEEDLGRCLLACLLRNHRAELTDHASLLFNQVVDDLLAFSERLLADPADIAAEDLHVLTDALLCLLGVESAALRAWINRVFARFAPQCDAECARLLEDAFFDEGEALPPTGDGSEELSDIEIPGKLL